MIDDEANKYNITIEYIKKYISEKEHAISMSELKINNLKNACKKLEGAKRKNKRQKIMFLIVFHTVCNIVIFSLLVSYIIPLIKVLEIAALTYQTLIIIAINAGVLGISFLGAYAMSKIGEILIKKIDRKNLKIISQIKRQKAELTNEIELQKELKTEISIMLKKANSSEETILSAQGKTSHHYNQEIILEDIHPKIIDEIPPYTKKKKK